MFDAHAHVSFSQFDSDRESVIERAREAGISGWLEVGTDIEQSRKAVAFAESQEGVFATVGVHPNDINSITEQTWVDMRELVQHPKVKAIGEVGFDFFRGGNLEEQAQAVRYFIQIAQEANLPLVFHVRSGPEIDAHDELLYVLSTFEASNRPRGVVHTFSGSLNQARKYLEYGLYLSFSGVITFPNAGPIIDAATWAPLDRIVIETDCPFLCPAPYRGKRNEPSYVRLVAEKLAEIKHVPVEKVLAKTEENAKTLFRLS